MKKGVGALVAAVLAGISCLNGCGSFTPPTASTALITVTVTQGELTLRAHRFWWPIPITTTAPGTLTLQVNWTLATNVFWLGIATPSCTVEAYQNFTCNFLGFSQTSSDTPSKSVTVQNAAAGDYVVIINNRGPGDESLTYFVTLTPSRSQR